MSEIRRVNAFDNKLDVSDWVNFDMPEFPENPTHEEILDYMVLVISRVFVADAAFKGGYMLNKLLDNSRMTFDVDFSIMQMGDYESVKTILAKIAEQFIASGLIATYKVKDTIAPTQSGGIDMYDPTGKKVLGVDVGLHNISYGIRHYNFGLGDINGFEIERMLSDKIIAILSRKRFRRTKDLYDLYAIVNAFCVDYEKLKRYIELRGGAEWNNFPFSEEVLVQYRKAWDKLELRPNKVSKQLDKPSFDEVLLQFTKFITPLKYPVDKVTQWDNNRNAWF